MYQCVHYIKYTSITKYMYQCVHYIKYTSIYTKYMYQCVHYIKYTSIYKVHVPMCPLYKEVPLYYMHVICVPAIFSPKISICQWLIPFHGNWSVLVFHSLPPQSNETYETLPHHFVDQPKTLQKLVPSTHH